MKNMFKKDTVVTMTTWSYNATWNCACINVKKDVNNKLLQMTSFQVCNARLFLFYLFF